MMKTLKPIEVEYYENLGQEDKIYIIYHRCHVFVGLFIMDLNLLLLADGGNLYIDKQNHQQELRSMIDANILPLRFNFQSGVDHCGSSAVMIALEFIRIYHRRDLYEKVGWPKEIICPAKLHKSIVDRFYDAPSEKESSPDLNILKRPRIKCPNDCGYTYLSTNKQKLSAHLKTCKPKY